MRGNFRTAVFLALKDILKNKRVIVLVLASLAFSFVNLLFTASIIKGFGITFRTSVININSEIIITPQERKLFFKTSKELEKRLGKIKGVKGVVSHLNSGVSLFHQGKNLGVSTNGIPPSEEKKVSILPKTVISGEFLKEGENNEVVIGKDLADSLKKGANDGIRVKVGEKLQITFNNGVTQIYRLKGIIDAKNFFANNELFLNKTEMEKALKVQDKASEILIKIDKLQNLEKIKEEIEEINLEGEVTTWKERASFIKELLKSINIIRNILSAVGLLITAIIIAAIIYINAETKKREMGIFKAIGAKNGAVLTLFITQSLIFAILGMVLGGGIFTLINFYLHENPIRLPFGNLSPFAESNLVLTYIVAFLLTTFIAGLYPAWRASREIIIKVIWGE